MEKKDKKKVLSNKEKYMLEIKNKYEDNKNFFEDGDINSKVYAFINKFVACEFLMKQMIYHYNHDTEKEFCEIRDIQLNMNKLYATIKFFNYDINKEDLKFIFNGDKTRGRKSCKELRNGFLHSFDSNDGYEIYNRFDSLMDCMDCFIHIIIS